MAEIVIMPKLGFDMAEGVLVRWVGQEGEKIARGAILAEIETDKATVEVESAYEGVILQHLVQQGEVVPVNTPIAVIGAPGETVDLAALGLKVPPAAAPQATKPPAATTPTISEPAIIAPAAQPVAEPEPGLPAGVRASPLARRMAKERGIDLSKVKGTGPSGRIVKADIEAYREPVSPVQAAAAMPEKLAVTFGEAPPDQLIPLSRLRLAISRRMTEAKQNLPHFYISYEYNVAPLLALRQQVNALLPEDEKLSVNDFIIKAVSLCLRSFPNLNASFDLKNEQVIQHGHVNIGVAVAVENGLLTVVCRDADLKPLRQIAAEVRTLVKRAREGKVRPDDIEGSTFSISNLGMFGVEDFQAIINPPEAAILAVSAARQVPVVENGEIKAGMRMKATISVDHRVSDGAEAARFMQELARYLEEPLRLLI